MTIELRPLHTVVTFNPRWLDGDWPSHTRLAWANGDAICADKLSLDTESASLEKPRDECLEDYRQFIDGDVVLPSSFTALEAGEVALAELAEPGTAPFGFCPERLIVMRADKTRLDSRFLLFFLRQGHMKNFIAVHQKENRRMLPQPLDFLRTLKIPLPPLIVQQHWCRQLEQAFAARTHWLLAAKALDATRRLGFINFFGSTLTQKEKWTPLSLSQVLDNMIIGYPTMARFRALRGEMLVRPCNLGCNRLVLDDVAYVQPPAFGVRRNPVLAGDVLFSLIDAGAGRSAVFRHEHGPAWLDKGMVVLRSKTVAPEYLAAFLSSGTGLGEIAQALESMPGRDLTVDAVRAMQLALPPRPMQQAFVGEDQEREADCSAAWARFSTAQAKLAALERDAFGG